MQLARIRDGIVVNVIEADAATPDWPDHVPLTGGAWIGWLYRDGAFVDPNPPVEDADV
ncbi:hypothetical protein [Falsirhodobacter halotolerans]|uniref:hypothetical protein n=1 Tax=Falsirhodobacter halotolerans TaxID=1146892 RepID=UPI001FD1BA24|nr:hypothetical protein [Falsirhodobacter halotolerans]MCJ8139527.1 hypothetical protein [Falsirhodobacter halotolerans]